MLNSQRFLAALPSSGDGLTGTSSEKVGGGIQLPLPEKGYGQLLCQGLKKSLSFHSPWEFALSMINLHGPNCCMFKNIKRTNIP